MVDSNQSTKTLDNLRKLSRQMSQLMEAIHERNLFEEPGKLEPKRYSMKETAQLVGRSYQAIREAERAGLLPERAVDPGTNRREGYTLEQINQARMHFGTRLRRGTNDEVVRLAFGNFKGGAGKTTAAVHFAQYCAQAGLRTLLVDTDPQASATSSFGFLPNRDIDASETLLTYFEDEAEDLRYAIRRTYWDGLDIIVSNLYLYSAEYTLASEASTEALQRLRLGLEDVEEDYDIIIMDQPPALGLIPLSVMHAANALVIPTGAAAYDLQSTEAFLTMLIEVAETLVKRGVAVDYHFQKLLITKLDENSETQTQLVDILPEVLGNGMLRQQIRKTAALDRAQMKGRSLYEIDASRVPRKSFNRALNHFDAVNKEILNLIRRSWPSHEADMRASAEI